MKRTVRIVGAGPAGLAAAIAVERSGGHAVVSEQHDGVGHRFHDDFQGLENWTTSVDVLEELRLMGIVPEFDHVPFHQFVVYDPEGRPHAYRSREPLWYLVRRGGKAGALDRSLAEQAVRAGAEIEFGAGLNRLPGGGVVAHGPHRAGTIAAGYVFETNLPNGAFAAVSSDLAPQGYSYLLVSGGRGTVASCMFSDFHRERRYVEHTVEFFGKVVGLEMREPRRFGGFGNLAASLNVSKGSLLYAGEAAGFQDALFGFGMRYALMSGYLAGRTAAMGGDGREYERLCEERFGKIFRRGLVNRYFYGRLGNHGYSALLRWIERSRDVRPWLRRHYSREVLGSLLVPLARRRFERRPLLVSGCLADCDCTWCRCQGGIKAQDKHELEVSR